MSAAVKAGWSLDKVPEGVKEDKNILMAGVQNEPRSEEKVSDEQKKDEEIWLEAMERKKEGTVKKLMSGTLIIKESNKNQIKNNIRNSEEKTSMRGSALPAPSSSEIYFFLFKLLFIN